jgi:hypothetical protein
LLAQLWDTAVACTTVDSRGAAGATIADTVKGEKAIADTALADIYLADTALGATGGWNSCYADTSVADTIFASIAFANSSFVAVEDNIVGEWRHICKSHRSNCLVKEIL